MSNDLEVEYNDKGNPCLSLDIDYITQGSGRMKSGRVDVLFFDFNYKLDILKVKLFGTERHTIFFGGDWAKDKHKLTNEETAINIDKICFDKELGLNIVTVEVANSLKAMRSNLLKLAAVLGEEAKGKTLVSKIDNLFLSKNTYAEKPVAIVWRARGLTDGRGSLVHDLLQAHGFRNLSEMKETFQGLQ